MIHATLKRTYSKESTQGELYIVDERICYTLELPDKGNQVGISCIPEGTYDVKLWESPSQGWCFKILDVEGRTEILIHIANWIRQLRGCVAVGLRRGNNAVYDSKLALDKLKRMFGVKKFKLTITEG